MFSRSHPIILSVDMYCAPARCRLGWGPRHGRRCVSCLWLLRTTGRGLHTLQITYNMVSAAVGVHLRHRVRKTEKPGKNSLFRRWKLKAGSMRKNQNSQSGNAGGGFIKGREGRHGEQCVCLGNYECWFWKLLQTGNVRISTDGEGPDH